MVRQPGLRYASVVDALQNKNNEMNVTKLKVLYLTNQNKRKEWAIQWKREFKTRNRCQARGNKSPVQSAGNARTLNRDFIFEFRADWLNKMHVFSDWFEKVRY